MIPAPYKLRHSTVDFGESYFRTFRVGRACALPVLVYEQHSKVVGEGGKDGLVRFKKHVPDSHRAVAQETKLPLSVELLQEDKTMVGQLHSTTYTESQRETRLSFLFRPWASERNRKTDLGVLRQGG